MPPFVMRRGCGPVLYLLGFLAMFDTLGRSARLLDPAWLHRARVLDALRHGSDYGRTTAKFRNRHLSLQLVRVRSVNTAAVAAGANRRQPA